MWLSKYFVIFVLYSCLGWIYETIYCTIKWKKWENRGFLYGPVCPIYGTGATAIAILIDISAQFGVDYTWWQVFLICSIGSFFLEYGTHWTLEKLFHAYWWDYSYKPLNLHGRVCLPYTLCFGVAGILVTYIINPFVLKVTSVVSPIGFEFLGLLFMLLIGVDIALTASALSNFDRYIMDADAAVDMHMEQFVTSFGAKAGELTDSMQAKIAEEREKYSLDRLRNRFDAMSAFSLHAVKRVVGYRPARGKDKIDAPGYGQRMLEFVKNHKPEIRNVRKSK